MDIPQIIIFLICWIVVFWFLAMEIECQLADIRVDILRLKIIALDQKLKIEALRADK